MVRFGSQIKCFSCDGIDMVGNLDNGVVVGVENSYFPLCNQLLTCEIDERQVNRELDSTLLRYLRKGGFFEQEQKKTQLDTAYLHVTDRCNLSCESCYSYKNDRNKNADLSTEKYLRIIDNVCTANPRSIVISGGEPFLRHDLPKLLERIRLNCPNCTITVLTNGIALKEEAVKNVASLSDCVSVSIDGASAQSRHYIRDGYIFNDVKRTVEFVIQTGTKAHLIPTIHSKNISDIPEYVRLAKEWGATISFSLLSCPTESSISKGLSFTANDLRCLSDEIIKQGLIENAPIESINLGIGARRTCEAGSRTISISADGKIYPCHMLHQKRYEMGSAFDSTIDNIIESNKPALGITSVEQINDCKACQYRYLCGGGCRARAAKSNNGIRGKDPYCELMTEYYSSVLSLISRTCNNK